MRFADWARRNTGNCLKAGFAILAHPFHCIRPSGAGHCHRKTEAGRGDVLGAIDPSGESGGLLFLRLHTARSVFS